MKVYVCPICDHVINGKHYCRICHRFVKTPYFMDMGYSLDRISQEPEKRSVQKEKQKKEKKEKVEQKMTKDLDKVQGKKRTYRVVWMVVIVYILFQIGMLIAGMSENVWEELRSGFGGLSLQKEKEIKKEEMIQEEVAGDWIYESPDYDEILEKGEESTGLEHFSIKGGEFTKKFQEELNDADFDVLETTQYMENYISLNVEQDEKYSYFQKMDTYYLSQDYREYYRITEDSVSERLISTEIESSDYDQVSFFTETAISLLFADNEKKQKKVKQMYYYLEQLLDEDTYFSETIGKVLISGYVYTNEDVRTYHISLSAVKDE